MTVATSPDDGVNLIGLAAHKALRLAGVDPGRLSFRYDERPFPPISWFADGEADVLIHEAIMTPHWQRIAAKRPVRYLPWGEQVLAAFAAEGWPSATVEAGYLPGLAEDLLTLDFSDFVLLCRPAPPRRRRLPGRVVHGEDPGSAGSAVRPPAAGPLPRHLPPRPRRHGTDAGPAPSGGGPRLLRRRRRPGRWRAHLELTAMAYVINEHCIDELDGSCVQSCPVDCIYEGLRKRYINPDECIDCGACLPECPVDAILAPDDSPDPVWAADNTAFFTEKLPGRDTPLGSPGGAEPTGQVGDRYAAGRRLDQDMTADVPILIIGGGIGGMTAALALARAGFTAHIVERSPEFGEIGAGIQLAPNALRILDGLGVLPELAELAVHLRPPGAHARRDRPASHHRGLRRAVRAALRLSVHRHAPR